jgi:hypothetical protein
MNHRSGYDIGYDIPAASGMDAADVQTRCLVLDLDAPCGLPDAYATSS